MFGLIKSAVGMGKVKLAIICLMMAITSFMLWQAKSFKDDYDKSIYDAGFNAASLAHEEAQNKAVSEALQSHSIEVDRQSKRLLHERDKALQAEKDKASRKDQTLKEILRLNEELKRDKDTSCQPSNITRGMLNREACEWNTDHGYDTSGCK